VSLYLGWEQEKRIIRAIAFTPVFFDISSVISAYILTPVDVHNTYQKMELPQIKSLKQKRI
tara:strand:+ start:747 stop:929 length:183 start_codon:yes stop_codon:yes gene_type:complete